MAERSSIVPEGESVRRALRWLSEQRQTDPAAPSAALVEEAAVCFDLTPLQGEFLLQRWAMYKGDGDSAGEVAQEIRPAKR